jgi:ABC-type multidrug transport system fused ATPase/permease subunit
VKDRGERSEVKDSQWRLIGGLLRPHRRELMLYGAVLAFATAVPMGSSLVLSRFVRLAIERAPSSRLAPLAIAYAALGLAASVMTIITTWRSTLLAWRITNDLRNDLASYVLHADLSFHRDRTPGELVSRVDGDITAMTEFLATVVARVIAIVALGIGVCGGRARHRPGRRPWASVCRCRYLVAARYPDASDGGRSSGGSRHPQHGGAIPRGCR